MSIQEILKTGANVSFTITAFDLKEWMLELIEEQTKSVIPIVPEKYFTTQETAGKLGVDISTLWRWDKTGYLKKVKLGNKVFYKESDINKLLEG